MKNRLVLVPVALLVLFGLWKYSNGGFRSSNPSYSFPAANPLHYPATIKDIKKAGGFWTLGLEEQSWVRSQYAQQLQSLQEEASYRIDVACQVGDLATARAYRNVALQIKACKKRMENPSCDPTNEQTFIVMAARTLSR